MNFRQIDIKSQKPKLIIDFFSFFQEQRAHIQFLGSTLQNAESNVVRLEEENRLKEGYAERVKQMTR